MNVIGLDVGTSGVKSTVFDEKANILYHASREYGLICGGDGMFELDPRLLLSASLEVLKESTSRCAREDVRAICVTSFGESFVCLDENNKILSNTMIYMDNRGQKECEEYLVHMPESKSFAVSGQYADRMFALYKLKWMMRHRPEVMERTVKICFISDFITYMLGGGHICDHSLAARSAMFDVRRKVWWGEAIAFSGIDSAILPSVTVSGGEVGNLSAAIARELGMSIGVKLIVGGHDQVFAAIGSGAYNPGDAANGMGTVDCMTVVMRDDADTDKLLEYKLPVVPYPAGDAYVTYSSCISGGCTLKWFRDTFAKDISNLPDAYALLEDEAPPAPTSLMFIPYLGGGGTPYMDAQTPAAIAGMRLNTSRGSLYRAFMEGESYEMRLTLDCLQDAGIETGDIVAVGGGSASPLWMQIRADIFGRKIFLPEKKEAGTLASALMCYVALGIYGSLNEAQKSIIHCGAPYVPNDADVKVYSENYGLYKKLYAAVRDVYRR